MKIRRLLVKGLTVSAVLCAAGIFLIFFSVIREKSHYCASSQIGFFRSMPGLISAGEKVKLPAYFDSKMLEKSPAFSASARAETWQESISIKKIIVRVNYLGFPVYKAESLVDGRSRQ